MELEQRLTLYQLFLKLYEHNRELLDDILQLEHTNEQRVDSFKTQYIVGVAQSSQVYLVANLLNYKTQSLFQGQNLWTIGRGRHAALSIPDKLLSRYHGVIQYIENEGFYLSDLNSTNGTFVNQNPIKEPTLLQDGDLIRIGSLVFPFFLCQTINIIEDVPASVRAKLAEANLPWEQPSEDQCDTLIFVRRKPEQDDLEVRESLPQLDTTQQSEILDRFFSQQN